MDVIASGLDLTSELYTFDITAELMCYADEVVKIKGECKKCGNPSSITEFTGESKEDIKITNNSDILIRNLKLKRNSKTILEGNISEK